MKPKTLRIRVRGALSVESANYYALAGLTIFLVVLGLVMVQSSSTIRALSETGNSFSRFQSQFAYALIGVALMLLISRIPPRFWKKFVLGLLGFACFLQLLALMTPLGVKIGDNTNWLRIGGFVGQPSEGIKLCLVIWLGFALSQKREVLHDLRQLALPAGPVAGGALLVVVLGGDLGTTVIMAGFVFGALLFAGARIKHLAVALLIAAMGAVLVAMSSATRRGRVFAFFGGSSKVNPDVDWQPRNGLYALGSGGLFGTGIGNSRAKWSWLPSADTDFIFAIIGEELGLVGTFTVLALFALLAAVFLRIIRAADDPRVQVTTGAILFWLLGQALVNVAVVVGLVPVLGVPLPFISAGGTALVSSLMSVGIVLSFTRKPRASTAGFPSG